MDFLRTTRRGRAAAAFALAALAALVLAGAGRARAVKGEFPPDFTATALDGRKITLSSFRGKNPVLLNFYADFCAPCRQEFPHLKALDEKYGPRGLRVLAVSLDTDRDTAANIPRQHRVRFPVLFDPKGSIAEAYQVQAIPHTVVLNREGRVSQIVIGFDPDALNRAVAEVIR